MPTTERTTVGIQYVLPGAERRTAPRSVYSVDVDGQLLIAGFEPVSESEKLRKRAIDPLKPRLAQKAAEYTPLFATLAHMRRIGSDSVDGVRPSFL